MFEEQSPSATFKSRSGDADGIPQELRQEAREVFKQAMVLALEESRATQRGINNGIIKPVHMPNTSPLSALSFPAFVNTLSKRLAESAGYAAACPSPAPETSGARSVATTPLQGSLGQVHSVKREATAAEEIAIKRKRYRDMEANNTRSAKENIELKHQKTDGTASTVFSDMSKSTDASSNVKLGQSDTGLISQEAPTATNAHGTIDSSTPSGASSPSRSVEAKGHPS